MSKPVIVLLHGMGNHSAPQYSNGQLKQHGSFYDEFVTSANLALKRYPGREGSTIEPLADIREIHYNDIFDELRERMAEEGKKISTFLPTLAGGDALRAIPGFLTKLAGFESSLADDDFIYTHWLDVLFYKTYVGEAVRARVAKELTAIFATNHAQQIHFVAHSLGTAVLHDTLHKLFGGANGNSPGQPKLSPTTHKVMSTWMIANVSRLANTIAPVSDPYDSIVRPGDSGMTNYMFNVCQELDPFTWPRRFNPKNDGKWIPTTAFGRSFHNIKTTLITEKNTHSFSQYIQDPEVNFPMFRLILGIDLSMSDKESAIDLYDNASIQGAYEELEGTLSDFSPSELGNISEIFDAGRRLKDFIKA